MFFDPTDELNKELRDRLVELSKELLYGDEGLMDVSIGKWITYHMLFTEGSDTSHNDTVVGMKVSHIEIIEDFLNSGQGSHNWKQMETISRETKSEWISQTLKKIINGEPLADKELHRYISSIVDQDKLVKYINEEIENFTTTRKDWLEAYISLPVMPIIMKYRTVASSLDSHEQQKKADHQSLINRAEDANTRVKAALKEFGTLEKRYDIDSVDSILDMLEEVVNLEDISENDVANFILMNAPRFDEDVRYLLTTRFPVSQEK